MKNQGGTYGNYSFEELLIREGCDQLNQSECMSTHAPALFIPDELRYFTLPCVAPTNGHVILF